MPIQKHGSKIVHAAVTENAARCGTGAARSREGWKVTGDAVTCRRCLQMRRVDTAIHMTAPADGPQYTIRQRTLSAMCADHGMSYETEQGAGGQTRVTVRIPDGDVGGFWRAARMSLTLDERRQLAADARRTWSPALRTVLAFPNMLLVDRTGREPVLCRTHPGVRLVPTAARYDRCPVCEPANGDERQDAVEYLNGEFYAYVYAMRDRDAYGPDFDDDEPDDTVWMGAVIDSPQFCEGRPVLSDEPPF